MWDISDMINRSSEPMNDPTIIDISSSILAYLHRLFI